MAINCDFVTYDVFTQTPYSGNPLAIVHLPLEGPSLTQDQKQKIAREFNYSETVFLHPETSPRCRRVDIFTRFAEIPFAGHPVIGTAQYLRQYIAGESAIEDVKKLRMIIKAGIVDVEFDDQGLAIAEVPHNLRLHEGYVSIEDILTQHPELVSLKSSFPERCPVVSSVKGMTNILIDASSAKDVLNILRPAKPPRGVILDEDFSPSPIGTHFYTKLESQEPEVERYQVRRMMVDGVEDPATGSAAVGLAGHLSLKHGKAGSRYRYEMMQGVEMGRKSDMFVDVVLGGTGVVVDKIFLSGHGVKIMKGKLAMTL